MAITRWQPSYPTLSVRDAFNQLFDESLWWPQRSGFGSSFGGFQAPMDVYTEGDGYVVEVALPGVTPEQIDVQMIGNTLTVGGELPVEAPEGRQYLMRQRPGGKFQASVTLPDAADAGQVKATFEHGILRLAVPKSEAARPKRIALNAGH